MKTITFSITCEVPESCTMAKENFEELLSAMEDLTAQKNLELYDSFIEEEEV